MVMAWLVAYILMEKIYWIGSELFLMVSYFSIFGEDSVLLMMIFFGNVNSC